MQNPYLIENKTKTTYQMLKLINFIIIHMLNVNLLPAKLPKSCDGPNKSIKTTPFETKWVNW